jgi:hypothetical protein
MKCCPAILCGTPSDIDLIPSWNARKLKVLLQCPRVCLSAGNLSIQRCVECDDQTIFLLHPKNINQTTSTLNTHCFRFGRSISISCGIVTAPQSPWRWDIKRIKRMPTAALLYSNFPRGFSRQKTAFIDKALVDCFFRFPLSKEVFFWLIQTLS